MVAFVKSVTFDCGQPLVVAVGVNDDIVVMQDPEGNELCVKT